MIANTDSQIMKSITLLTMIFLPATFISVSNLTPIRPSNILLRHPPNHFQGFVQHHLLRISRVWMELFHSILDILGCNGSFDAFCPRRMGGMDWGICRENQSKDSWGIFQEQESVDIDARHHRAQRTTRNAKSSGSVASVQ